MRRQLLHRSLPKCPFQSFTAADELFIFKQSGAIRLDEHEFRQLVAGKEVITTAGNTGELVRMILADIGFTNMRIMIDEAAGE